MSQSALISMEVTVFSFRASQKISRKFVGLCLPMLVCVCTVLPGYAQGISAGNGLNTGHLNLIQSDPFLNPAQITVTFPHWPFMQTSGRSNSCVNVNNDVNLSSQVLRGPGHCAGEVTGVFVNNLNVAVDCTYAFHKNGRFTAEGTLTVPAGQRRGGEGGGVWTCGAEDIQMRYVCYEKGATNSIGQECVYQTREF